MMKNKIKDELLEMVTGGDGMNTICRDDEDDYDEDREDGGATGTW